MTESLLGCHWIREHPDQQDMPHIAAMQYKSVKLFKPAWNNRDFCRDLLAVLPKNALILARDHELSEQKQDMWADPVGTGTRHANEFAFKVAMGEVHVPVERTYFLGINEPDATDGDRNAIDLYTEAFLRRLVVHGLRGGAFNFSTGHPRTKDGTPNTHADYTVFERSHRAILEGKHIAVLHIYGTANTPCVPGHYDRLRHCPWQDVRWIVGECGIDEHVIGGGEHLGFHHGFKGRLHEYARWLDEFILGTHDKRIHSYQVFTYDFSHPWSSFDLHPIRSALEAYDWQHMKAPIPPGPTEPAPPSKPQATVNVTAGARIRKGPSTEHDVLGAVPYGTMLPILGKNSKGTWWQVISPFGNGWVSGTVVRSENTKNVPVTWTESTPPPPEPAPINEQDNWKRCLAFVRRWEGGYVDDPNDSGGATNKGITLGTYTAWRKAHGEPAPSKQDLRAIPDALVDRIYYEWYWLASGSDKMAWPLCLAHFDTSVNAGVDRAQEMLAKGRGRFLSYMGHLEIWYTTLEDFEHFGRAWIRRRAEILLEADK